MTLAVTAGLLRLLPLQWLHPLNWDELEFFHATRQIAGGLLPYRDFWEHHTPLTWLLFAPFTLLSDSAGVDAVIVLRWAQIPVWILTFWLTSVWMRNAGIARFARWAAMALALSSSMFMIPAVEYRVDSVACALFMAGLVLAQRGTMFGAGVLFCLCGFANLRFGPLLVVTVLLLRIVEPGERRWAGNREANRLFAGGFAALAAVLAVFAATGSLAALYQQVWADNTLEKFAQPIVGGFVHRLLVPFGIRILASDRLFDPAAVDAGGIAILLLGVAGMFRAASAWRSPGHLVFLAVLQLTNILFVAAMKFIYNYHFLLVVVLMIPFVAEEIERFARSRRRVAAVIAIVALAWCVNAFASAFRGKELDRAYQDLVMREIEARTPPGETVWSGAAWAVRRDPAYHFWFLPELARIMVKTGRAERYHLEDLVARPPAVVVFDHNLLVWIVSVQRELAPYLVRHYAPLWRELWIPAMNVRLEPGGRAFTWIVPRTGAWRVYASHDLAKHAWFRDPLSVVTWKREDASRFTVRLPETLRAGEVQWLIDGRPAEVGATVRLVRGQRLTAANRGPRPLALFLLPGEETLLFRQPPPGATLEGETTRVTHLPRIGLRLP